MKHFSFAKIFLFWLSLIQLYMLFYSSPASAVGNDQISIKITQIPKELKSIYLPLKVSPINLKLKEVDFASNILQGFISEVHYTPEGALKGLSLSVSRKEKNLPEDLEVIMEVSTSDQKEASATIEFAGGYVYSKVLKPVPGASVGFDRVILIADPVSDKQEKKAKSSFYIKALGQNLNHQSSSLKAESSKLSQSPSRLQELHLKIKLPKGYQAQGNLYIPIALSSQSAINIEPLNVNWKEHVLVLSSSNILMLTPTDMANLPENKEINLGIKVEDQKRENNSILLGEVLTEPAAILPGVIVEIIPAHLTINKRFNLKEYFSP